MNPLTVRFYDVKTNRTVTRFLDMCYTSGEDCGLASSIFNEIDSKMTENMCHGRTVWAFQLIIPA